MPTSTAVVGPTQVRMRLSPSPKTNSVQPTLKVWMAGELMKKHLVVQGAEGTEEQQQADKACPATHK
jgi:hypothetical protein